MDDISERGRSGGSSATSLATLSGQIAVTLYLTTGLGAVFEFVLLPAKLVMLVLLVLVGVQVMLSPHGSLGRIIVPVPIALLLTWVIISVAWTPDIGSWILITALQVSGVVVMVVTASLLSAREFTNAIKASFWLGLTATFVAFVVQPARSMQHIDLQTGAVVLPGWHGSFVHKSEMVAFLTIGVLTLIYLGRRSALRSLVLVVVAVLVIFARSSTGLSAVVALLFVGWWLDRLRRQGRRTYGSFLAVSSAVGVLLMVAVLVLLPVITDWYGKDLTLSGRTLIWDVAFEQIAQRPWLGYTSAGVWVDFTTSPTFEIVTAVNTPIFHAHNSAVEILLRLGMVGLVLYVFVIGDIVRRSWRLLPMGDGLGEWGIMIAAFVLVQSITEVVVFGAWMGLLSGVLTLVTCESRRTQTGDGRPGARSTRLAQVAA